MSNVAFIMARLSSKRLPAKNLMEIVDKPMIQHLVNRIKKAKSIDKVVIATSDHPSDHALEEFAQKEGIDIWRGSLDNMMERLLGAVEHFGATNIIEILGDNPLVHSDLIDDTFEFYKNGNYDCATTLTNEFPQVDTALKRFAIGIRVQIYKASVARDYKQYPDYFDDSKHFSSYMFDYSQKYKAGYFEATGKWDRLCLPELNFAVNYRKNFNFVERVFENNYRRDDNFTLFDVVKDMEADPKMKNLLGAEA